MRVVLCTLMAFACLGAPGFAQSPERSLDLSDGQKAEIRKLLGEGERQLQLQHDEAFRELSRILSRSQMDELRQMSRWGRYGPPMDATSEAESMLTVLSQLDRASATQEAARRLRKLVPTPEQGRAFQKALEGGAPGMETRLRAVFTPEQLEFLRQLERLERSEDW